MSARTVFSTAYFPPVSYVMQCISSGEVRIEQHEHFIKQTYRNRCHIYNSNGLLPLIIPVEHIDLHKKPIRDVKISFGADWKKNHWRAICSAYRNAPFFEFLEDELSNAFHVEKTFLVDFNTHLLENLFSISKLQLKIEFSDTYEEKLIDHMDLRNTFHPKKQNQFSNPVYHQVFADKHGFLPDLSCIDLLANEGSLRI